MVPGHRLGRYEILAKLGEGGMGVVYKARDLTLHRKVAIKVLPAEATADPERSRRFMQEAQAASALNHPGIVTIHEIAREHGVEFIAMELVEGKTLAELIGRNGLPLKEMLNYAIQAASAIAKAHAANIVHRDLKPSNVMVSDDGLVKILDFGVAKLLQADAGDAPGEMWTTVETTRGRIVGTVAYMSPEQAEGRRIDARSDIFSFGTVLYEMATGARAFEKSSAAMTLSAVLTAEPTRPGELRKDLPRDLERIILRCLRKDPARRVQVMTDLVVELEEIKTESGTRLAPTGSTRTGGHGARNIQGPLVGMAALIVVAAITWLLWPRSGASLSGASIVPLTALPGDERSASLSPDGNQVAFSWDGGTSDNRDIYVMPVGAGTPLRLTNDAADDVSPSWSPDGSQIAFLRAAGSEIAIYMATPPMPNSERLLTTVPRGPIGVDDVVGTLSWFPDGRRLAIAAGESTNQMSGIVVVGLESGTPRRLTWSPVTSGRYKNPAISPSGKVLAYSLCVDNFSCDLYVLDLDSASAPSGQARRLTTMNALTQGIAWAPDGKSLVFGAGGSYNFFLWRVPLDGGAAERIDLAGERATYPAVSTRASLLAYERNLSNPDLWKFDGTRPRESVMSSTRYELNPQISPDGKLIVFESNRLGPLQIWVGNTDGTNLRALDAGGSPRWSPDSRSIVYDNVQPNGQQGVFVADVASGRGRLLTSGNLPSWSRDGRWVYFSQAGNGFSRIPASGGTAVRVQPEGNNALESPDGQTVYYRKPAAAGVLFAASTAGGPERQVLTSMVPSIHQFVPFNDGVYFVRSTADAEHPFSREIRFFDLATNRENTLHRFDARSGSGLSVSPDRTTFFYSGTNPADSVDLMLIRDFH